MSDYRRIYIPSGTFFFTVVTEDRAPFLCDDRARAILRRSIKDADTAQKTTNEQKAML